MCKGEQKEKWKRTSTNEETSKKLKTNKEKE
jgi:hypothetical protein